MIIKSLQQYDERTASGILARLALGSSTNPGVGIAAGFATEFGTQELKALSEIRERLKIHIDDRSSEASTKILEVLSSAMSDSVLRDKDRQEITARAGSEGRLPPSMYRIVIPEGFMKNFRQFGVRESHVKTTISAADDCQHLMTDEVFKDLDRFSVFLKWYSGKNMGQGYWAIATTYREGIQLIVQHLWRVYPDQVDLPDAIKPIDVLTAFCKTFGLDVVVGDMKAKLILQQRLPTAGGPTAEVTWSVTPSNVPHITTAAVRKELENPFVDVGIVYAIDVERYKASLRQQGVKLS